MGYEISASLAIASSEFWLVPLSFCHGRHWAWAEPPTWEGHQCVPRPWHRPESLCRWLPHSWTSVWMSWLWPTLQQRPPTCITFSHPTTGKIQQLLCGVTHSWSYSRIREVKNNKQVLECLTLVGHISLSKSVLLIYILDYFILLFSYTNKQLHSL